jgi:16S rRNA processing protein RimM
MSGTEVVVGRIGKAHGVRGEVSVEPRTDEPERRFADGSVLLVRSPAGRTGPETGGAPPSGRPTHLCVSSTRWHQSRLLLTFEGVTDRTAAEALRGLLLVAEVDADERPEDPEEFYDHQLVGLEVRTMDAVRVGTVTEVVHGPGQDLLSVRATDGREVLVPFVAALVPEVDVVTGHVVVVDQPGLLTPAVDDEAGGA